MRVVVDCNVIVSAALSPKGITAKALRKAEENHFLLASSETIEELSEVIFRPKFDRYFSPVDIRMEIIARYAKLIEWVVPYQKISLCRDPKDDRYLEVALSGKADCIVSGDPDLQILNPFENIPIISPKEFLEHF